MDYNGRRLRAIGPRVDPGDLIKHNILRKLKKIYIEGSYQNINETLNKQE